MRKSISIILLVILLVTGDAVLAAPYRSRLKKIEDYLYEVTFTDYDPADLNILKHEYPLPNAGCSTVWNGRFVGRNMDMYYDDTEEYIVHVTKAPGRHASLSITGSYSIIPPDAGSKQLTREEQIRLLPFYPSDGINDAGLVVSTSFINTDYGPTTGTNPGQPPFSLRLVQRYLLDNAATAREAVALLQKLNLVNDEDIELQYLIADRTECIVAEIVGNKLCLSPSPIMTNFLFTPKELPLHAIGTERYNTLKKHYALGKTKEGMFKLMDKVCFYRAYTGQMETPWYSEFNDPDFNEFDKSPATLNQLIAMQEQEYKTRKRRPDSRILQTTHLAVYDLDNCSMSIIAQENGRRFDFTLEGATE